MKKSMSIIAALALATSMVSSLPTFAAETKSEIKFGDAVTQGSVVLTHAEASSYKVTIPADITLDKDETLEISASDVHIGSGKSVKVTVASENSWKMTDKDDTNNQVPYTVTMPGAEEALTNGTQVLSVDSVTGTDSVELSIAAPASYTYAGNYSDTLTFTVNAD